MDDSMDVERLKILLEQENRMLSLLESSCKELGSTIDELQSRYDVVEDESNEWKTRYEIQAEINDQLRKQLPILTEKLEEAKGAKKSGRPNIWSIPTDGLITNYTLTMLERRKLHMKSQESEILSRVDQEAKAYYKADEQRRAHRLELNAIAPQQYDLRKNPKATAPNTNQKYAFGHRVPPEALGNRNIPPDQRIINARHGPIKKTAAVKQLPALPNERYGPPTYHSPERNSHQTPQASNHQSPQVSMHQSPQISNHQTPHVSNHQTPHVSNHQTPHVSNHQTPHASNHQTPRGSIHQTPERTMPSTPPGEDLWRKQSVSENAYQPQGSEL